MSINSVTIGEAGHETFVFHNLRKLKETLRKWNAWKKAYNTTFHELTKLSDRDLSDLGMARADIHSIAKDAANDTVGAL